MTKCIIAIWNFHLAVPAWIVALLFATLGYDAYRDALADWPVVEVFDFSFGTIMAFLLVVVIYRIVRIVKAVA